MEKNIPNQEHVVDIVKEPEFREIEMTPGFRSWLDDVSSALKTYPVHDQARMRSGILQSFNIKSSEQLLPKVKNMALSLYVQHKFMSSVDLKTYMFLKRYMGNPPQSDEFKFVIKDGKWYGFYKENMTVADLEEAIKSINTADDLFNDTKINSTPETKFSVAIKVGASQDPNSRELAQYLVDEAHLTYTKNYDQIAQDNYYNFVSADIFQNVQFGLVPFILRWAANNDKQFKNTEFQDLKDSQLLTDAINNRQLCIGYQQIESQYIDLYNSVMALLNALITETKTTNEFKKIIVKHIQTNKSLSLPGVARALPDTLTPIVLAKTYLKLQSHHAFINTLINERIKTLAKEREAAHQVKTPQAKPFATDSYGSQAFKNEQSNKLIINDAVNHAQLTLIKSTEKKLSAPEITYTKNIVEWFESPELAKANQGYLVPGSRKHTLTATAGYDPVLLHAFSTLVDRFIPDYATQTETPSRRTAHQQDILYTIPGGITDKNAKEITGIFTYLRDSATGHIYHRFFEPQLGSQLIKGFYENGHFAPASNGYYDLAFPPLSAPAVEKNK
ncbi:hypothetical protein Noda2021_11090 [Candidatus Dependentiae bacterium Noda2021]|nr:hypothetical protein Noda2021_11090 [Candidatus Dependentiae bacterium Noda2021]